MPKADLTLGGAQLGMAYGIANHRGKMNEAEVFDFLDEVCDAGISRIDTSPAYGDSETLIGKYLRVSGRSLHLVTKLPALGLTKPTTAAQLIPLVEASLHKSLETLGVAAIDDYLVHTEEDFVLHGATLVEALRHCREQGLVERVGVSVYQPEVALKGVTLGLDTVQIPCNILDRRLDNAGFFTAAKRNRTKVFARSIYLQGLLLLPIDDVIKWLPEAEQPLSRFHKLAADCGYSPAELAYVYMRDKNGVDSLIVGMESKAQVVDNLALMQAPVLPDELRVRIESLIFDVSVQVLNPSLWRRR